MGKPKKVSAFSLLKLFFILIILGSNEMWEFALFSILIVALYSEIYVIHNVPLKQDIAFIYYRGDAKKMNVSLGTSNCQENDC